MPQKQTVGNTKPTTSRALPKAGPAREQEEQQEQAQGGQSRADLFRSAKTAEGFDFPVGQYTANLVEAVALRDGDKETVCYKYTVNDGGEQDGKTCCSFYNFFDADGNACKGMEFFKKDLNTLEEDPDLYVEAYAEGQAEFDDRLRLLGDERKNCVIEVKKSKNFTNVYLQGLVQE